MAELDSQSVSVMFCIGYTRTLLEELIEDILGTLEFYEVGRTLLEGLHEETLGIVEFHEVGRTLLEGLHEESLGVVEFHEIGKTLLEGLHEESLGIVESHEVGRNLLEGLHEESLSIAEFREVGRNFFEILHEILLVVVVYEVGILYLLVHSNLLRIRSLHEVIRKLPSGLRVVILHCRYWSDVLHFYFILPLIYFVFIFSSPFLCNFLLWDILLRRNHMFHRN